MSSESCRAAHRPSRVRRRGRPAGLLAALVLVVAACSASTPTPVPTAQVESLAPIEQTPWPGGTIGQYGLRIDPSLLARLPQTIVGFSLVEDATSEQKDMADPDLANNFDSFAAGVIGVVGDPNWLNVAIGVLKPDAQTADFYTSWVSEYSTGACSQADGVAATGETTINDWTVDTATCAGSPVVYILMLDEQTLLSMWGAGPLDLGRLLIERL